MLKSEPCDNDDEMNLFKDLMSALKDPAYNPIDLIKSSRRLEEHLKTTVAEVQLDVLAQCSKMTMSQEVFKQTLFLQITKKKKGKRSLRCFINIKNEDFLKPAVMVHLGDLSLWITSKFTLKCTMLALSAEAFEKN